MAKRVVAWKDSIVEGQPCQPCPVTTHNSATSQATYQADRRQEALGADDSFKVIADIGILNIQLSFGLTSL